MTTRRYTGHEHLDEVGLIHMNGRVYDPTLARFMSADILVPDPYDTQSYNRYSYVRNRPMFYTDPSGFEGHADDANKDPVIEKQLHFELLGASRTHNTMSNGRSFSDGVSIVSGGESTSGADSVGSELSNSEDGGSGVTESIGGEGSGDGDDSNDGSDTDWSDNGFESYFDNANADALSEAGEALAGAFIPGAGVGFALARGDYKGAAIEAGIEAGAVVLGALTAGAGYYAVKGFRAWRAARKLKKALSVAKTPAQRLADKAQGLSSSKRPRVVAVVEHADGTIT